jgi:hypothetical protein
VDCNGNKEGDGDGGESGGRAMATAMATATAIKKAMNMTQKSLACCDFSMLAHSSSAGATLN